MTTNQKILFLALASVLTVSLMVKIDLFTADLGRHIKNGEIVLTGSAAERTAVVTTNYYSYTEGGTPFVNHHWLSGVIFFLFFTVVGFSGLSILYIAGMVAAFWLIFDLIRDRAHPWILFTISCVGIVVIASRAEVRPEVFTYLFAAFFLWVCLRYDEGSIDKKWLWLMPAVQLLWVNLHVGFILGPFIIGVFFLSSLVRKHFSKAVALGRVLLAACLVMLANPSFIRGALYPFHIFDSYSYRVFENQSISFLEHLDMGNPYTFSAYKILVALVLVSSIVAAFVQWRKISAPLLIVSAVYGVMGWFAIRDFPLFGLVGVAATVTNIEIIREHGVGRFKFLTKEMLAFPLFFLLAMAGMVLALGLVVQRSSDFGIGVKEGAHDAIEFFKANEIKGPLFNNYDSGGYAIFGLFPGEKVFFDNRPEAYTKRFVDGEYIAAMENPALFKELEKTYAFNAILFYYRDYTPWGQAFITTKVFDPEWAPVYLDTDMIILLKRNSQNESIVAAHEIPQKFFTVSK
ncbi:MAG: hypothetical protein WC798_00205 [Candidatus Paceibacterota bacterium]|jgi:hypothetical protein